MFRRLIAYQMKRLILKRDSCERHGCRISNAMISHRPSTALVRSANTFGVRSGRRSRAVARSTRGCSTSRWIPPVVVFSCSSTSRRRHHKSSPRQYSTNTNSIIFLPSLSRRFEEDSKKIRRRFEEDSNLIHDVLHAVHEVVHLVGVYEAVERPDRVDREHDLARVDEPICERYLTAILTATPTAIIHPRVQIISTKTLLDNYTGVVSSVN